MHQLRQGVDALTVDEDVELDQVGLAIVEQVVVKGPIPLGDRLELVVEVEDHLGQRDLEDHLQPVAGEILVVRVRAAALEAEFHDRPHVAVRDNDAGADERLQGGIDQGGVGVERRVVDRCLGAVAKSDPVADRGGRQDQGEPVFALEALLHDLQMQETQKAAAKPKAQCDGRVFFVHDGGIVQLQLLKRRRQLFVIVGRHGVDGREHDGLGFLEPRQRLGTGPLLEGDGVSAARVADRFDGGREVAHLAGG